MSIYPEFSPQNITGVDVFLERFQTRIYVGKLEKLEDNFHFTYDSTYLKAKSVLPLGPELPLTREEFFSKDLFPSFVDRLPDPNNPAYPDYCAATGISPDVSNPIILLSTIGKRGPSSFIFEPIYKETFSYVDCEKFREQLGLSMQDFANLFDVSLSILQKIKAGETSGKEVLKRLEQYVHFPESLDLQIKRNAKWLHSKKQNLLLKENIIILNFLKDILLKFDDENNFISLEEAINLASRADTCYSILAKTDFRVSASKDFNDDKKRFIYEIKPIITIAAYLKSLGNEPEKIRFCSYKTELGYDGVIYGKDEQEICLELTRAIGGKEGGKNENFANKLLEERGMAPFGQKIDYTINKRNINFGTNNLLVQVDSHKTHIPARLKLALKEKIEKVKKNQNIQKYKDHWLIITVPLYWSEDTFHEVCARFWKSAYKTQSPFSRVFAITEEFIRTGDIVSINCDEIHHNLPARVKKRNLEQSIWDAWNDEHKIHFLLRLLNIEFNSENGQELYNLLLRTSDNILIKNLDYIAKWLLQTSQNIKPNSESKFFELFDRVAQCACKIRITERLNDPINGAFNHPVGDLTRCILLLLDKSVKLSNGIPDEIKLRLTDLVQDSNDSQLTSLIFTSIKLRDLYEIDKKWVKQHILKHFKWEQQNQSTQYIWQAFIAGIYTQKPTLPRDLFSEIKQDFLDSIKHVQQKEAYQNLCYVLMYLYFCEEEFFNKEDFSKEILENLNIEQLAHISFAIFQLLYAAGEKSDRLWTNKINSWIKTNWPKEKQCINSKISDSFVRAAIKSRDSFGEAEKTLSTLGLFTVSPDLFILLHELLCADIPRKFPNETLDLLGKICPDNSQSISSIFSGKEKLKDILWVIRNENSKITDDQVYKKLLNYIQL